MKALSPQQRLSIRNLYWRGWTPERISAASHEDITTEVVESALFTRIEDKPGMFFVVAG